MRFNQVFAQKSIFTEMFQKTDWVIFNHAYKAHDDKNKLDRSLSVDREWVEDVILFWSEKTSIPLSLAVSVFQTGKFQAVQAHYRRLLEKSLREAESIRQSAMDDAHKGFAMDKWQKKHREIELVCKWDDGDLANWCRATFVEALGTTHPKYRFDAHTKRVKDTRPKVVNPAIVKQRQPKSEPAKRNRRKQEQQANAA